MSLLHVAIQCGVRVWVENPRSSLIWLVLQDLRGSGSSFDEIVFCQCQLGARWMKPTKLWIWNVPDINDQQLAELGFCMCDFQRVGKGLPTWCPKQARPHFSLNGFDGKVAKTKQAARYTPEFSLALAKLVFG